MKNEKVDYYYYFPKTENTKTRIQHIFTKKRKSVQFLKYREQNKLYMHYDPPTHFIRNIEHDILIFASVRNKVISSLLFEKYFENIAEQSSRVVYGSRNII